jgi:hypothetical protein
VSGSHHRAYPTKIVQNGLFGSYDISIIKTGGYLWYIGSSSFVGGVWGGVAGGRKVCMAGWWEAGLLCGTLFSVMGFVIVVTAFEIRFGLAAQSCPSIRDALPKRMLGAAGSTDSADDVIS